MASLSMMTSSWGQTTSPMMTKSSSTFLSSICLREGISILKKVKQLMAEVMGLPCKDKVVSADRQYKRVVGSFGAPSLTLQSGERESSVLMSLNARCRMVSLVLLSMVSVMVSISLQPRYNSSSKDRVWVPSTVLIRLNSRLSTRRCSNLSNPSMTDIMLLVKTRTRKFRKSSRSLIWQIFILLPDVKFNYFIFWGLAQLQVRWWMLHSILYFQLLQSLYYNSDSKNINPTLSHSPCINPFLLPHLLGKRGDPGIEPGTSCTLNKNHTTRPIARSSPLDNTCFFKELPIPKFYPHSHEALSHEDNQPYSRKDRQSLEKERILQENRCDWLCGPKQIQKSKQYQYIFLILLFKELVKYMRNQQEPNSDTFSSSQQQLDRGLDQRAGVKKILSKSEQIDYLIRHKGYIKVKINSHLSLQAMKGEKKETKTKIILVPSSYNVYKLKEEIKRNFNVNEKEAIFLFIKSQKIVDSNMVIKQMYQKFVGSTAQVGGCLELSVYNSQFS